MESRVPRYSTSIEGGGAIVLSPDEKEFLLVLEYGCWSRAGGATDIGESCLETAMRELREETGIELDDTFETLLGVGCNQPRSRDGLINDHFMYFIVKAKSKTVKMDETEIQGTRWFNVKEMVGIFRKFKSDWEEKSSSEQLPFRMAFGKDGKEWVSTLTLLAMERFVDKQARPVRLMKDSKRQASSIMF
mmetsp:Transcript_12984/g.20820  ORF Transcript_12984/g.20820 Transcript_12984/m.20820 type:complete len:190 (-) Transcript_12984:306-875(-)|eukprot:jgi/Bigna1/146739/aug1.120_g21447